MAARQVRPRLFRTLIDLGVVLACAVAALAGFLAFIAGWGWIAGHDYDTRIIAVVERVDGNRVCIQPDTSEFLEDAANYGGCFDYDRDVHVVAGDCIDVRVPYQATGEDRVVAIIGVVDPSRCSK